MQVRVGLPMLAAPDRPLECVQRPGELLYVPEGWYHGATQSAACIHNAMVTRAQCLLHDFFHEAMVPPHDS
jgi:ribosomal protein L16 Arg81 hydroxylase